jgi:hypothetical protein
MPRTPKPPPECLTCGSRGQIHVYDPTRCQAHSKTKQAQCGQRPSPGQRNCWAHGGATPVARAKAARVKSEAAVAAAAATYGVPVDAHPLEHLLTLIRNSAGHVEWLRVQVQAYSTQDISWGQVEEVYKEASEFPGTDITFRAVPPVLLQQYEKERAFLAKLCIDVLHTGVEERLVQLAQLQGRNVGPWLEWLVVNYTAALGAEWSAETWEAARGLVMPMLRGLGLGELPPPYRIAVGG